MKKALIFMLTIMLILSFSTSVSAIDTLKQTDPILEDTVVFVQNLNEDNLSAEVQFISASKNSKSKVKINNIEVYNDIVTLNGEVSINEFKKVPFDLKGELKRIDTSDDIIVANLVDKNDNFDVIHFSINDKSLNFISASGKKYPYTTLNVYLQHKGTRDFVFAEMKLPNKLVKESLFNNINNLSVFDAKDLFWYAKIINPAKTSLSDQITIMGADVQNKTQQDYHTLTYVWIGESYTEYVFVNNKLDYPGDSSDYRATGIIEKYYSYTKNNTTGSIVSYSTTAEIHNSKIEMSFSGGAIINYLFVGGIRSSGNTWQASIGYSMNTPIPGVGISFSYTHLTTTITYPVQVGRPSISAELTGGEMLLNNGEHMLVRSEYSNSGRVYAKFTYTISTPFSSTGTKTMTTQLDAEAL